MTTLVLKTEMEKLRIRFDDRERALLSAFQTRPESSSSFVTIRERLPMGDVIIDNGAESSGLVVVVERKRVDDLMASVFDGRLAEQSARLKEWQTAQGGVARHLTPTPL